MHQLNLNGKEALVIDVDEHGKYFKIAYDNHLWYQYSKFNKWLTRVVELPKGKWSILGTLTNGVPDFDVREYVEENSEWVLSVKHILGYRGYCGERKIRNGYFSSYPLDTPQESFLSLLHSQNITTEGKKVVLVNQSK